MAFRPDASTRLVIPETNDWGPHKRIHRDGRHRRQVLVPGGGGQTRKAMYEVFIEDMEDMEDINENT